MGKEIPKSSISGTPNLQYVEEGRKATYLWETDRFDKSPPNNAVKYPCGCCDKLPLTCKDSSNDSCL